MPKKTTVPTDLFVAIQGRTIDLVDLFSGNPGIPQSPVISFIASTLGTYVGKANIICNDKQSIRAAIQEREPLLIRSPNLYLFGKQVWSISKEEQTYNKDQLRLIFLEALDAEREKWERLKRKFSGIAGDALEYERKPIPQNVRVFVWRRDEGKCVQCGNKERLEFDHIVPVSKGGSNTERNIQLLCENCNRKKSAKI